MLLPGRHFQLLLIFLINLFIFRPCLSQVKINAYVKFEKNVFIDLVGRIVQAGRHSGKQAHNGQSDELIGRQAVRYFF